jgi:cathepsin O
LIDCSLIGGEDCDGGWPATALTEWQDNRKGLIENKLYTYKSKKGTCLEPSLVTGKKYPVVGRYPPHPSEYIFPEGGETVLQELVAKYGVVSVGVNACKDWRDYGSGIFDSTACDGDCFDINHAVTVVGYDKSGPVPYWLVRFDIVFMLGCVLKHAN